MIIKICIGSSCHLKNSAKLVELFEEKLKECNLENVVTLEGSFCMGKCNRSGVSVQINDENFTGVTPENFYEFFNENILNSFNL